MTFAPKDVETLTAEVLEDLGLSDYEGNEEIVDRVVARRQKDEDLKVSLHDDKTKAREKLKETRKLAGLDPETGEKLQTNVVEAKSEGLSAKDVVALRDVHEEDVDYLLEESKLRGKSVSELKADPYMKIILKTKAEERQTANAVNTGGSKRNSGKDTAENVVDKFHNGEEVDFEKLAAAEMELKLKGLKN